MVYSVLLGVAIFVFTISFTKLLEAIYAAILVPAFPTFTKDQAPLELPRLSVVVPARNEEPGLESSLTSLLEQDYPELEVVLVNDRSTDRTGEVLEDMARDRRFVETVHVERLPEGWLGKNYAVHSGARRTSGDWLLLTDADVRFYPGTLRRTVAYAEQQGLDHLTLVPRWALQSYWLKGIVAFFYMVMLLYGGYYRANLPRWKKGVGVGAFNLIRHSAYEAVGGYESLARRPDDDLSLGSRVKGSGLRQQVLLGHHLVSVKWYDSLGALARGSEKNFYATFDYSLPKTALYSASLALVAGWPFVAVFFSPGYALLLYLASIVAQLGTYAITNRFLGWRVAPLTVGYPAFAVGFAGLLVRSALFALLRGGIYWRGTFYPTTLLRGERASSRKKLPS